MKTKRKLPKTTRVKFSNVKVKSQPRYSEAPQTALPQVAPAAPVASNTPLRVDTGLVNHARTAGELADRSATAQLEHWAKLGRAVESVLSGESVAKLKRISRVPDISEILAVSQSPEGRAKVEKIISRSGIPTYGTDPRFPGFIMQHNPDGTVIKGRFLNRNFAPAS